MGTVARCNVARDEEEDQQAERAVLLGGKGKPGTYVCSVHNVDDRIRSSCISIPHIPELGLTLFSDQTGSSVLETSDEERRQPRGDSPPNPRSSCSHSLS